VAETIKLWKMVSRSLKHDISPHAVGCIAQIKLGDNKAVGHVCNKSARGVNGCFASSWNANP
jgi:hypothetical protein